MRRIFSALGFAMAIVLSNSSGSSAVVHPVPHSRHAYHVHRNSSAAVPKKAAQPSRCNDRNADHRGCVVHF